MQRIFGFSNTGGKTQSLIEIDSNLDPVSAMDSSTLESICCVFKLTEFRIFESIE